MPYHQTIGVCSVFLSLILEKVPASFLWYIFKYILLVAQSYLTLCDSMNCNLLGSSVHGVLQARILEWVAIPFSGGSSQPRGQTLVFCIAGRFFTIWV